MEAVLLTTGLLETWEVGFHLAKLVSKLDNEVATVTAGNRSRNNIANPVYIFIIDLIALGFPDLLHEDLTRKDPGTSGTL